MFALEDVEQVNSLRRGSDCKVSLPGFVMKNNLRSRPRRLGNETFVYEEWLSRFERELRERYRYLDAGAVDERLYEKGRADMIKEILGEERRM